jgi:hypothetical protein
VWSAVTGGDPAPLYLPGHIRGVVVLVADGVGRTLLDAHPQLAPTLTAAPGPTLDACFPATTSTNLTSLATGHPPATHGITGSFLILPGQRERLSTLTWTFHRMDGVDAREQLPPEGLQTVPTVFERAGDAGVRVTRVLREEFIGSGLTRAALRGGDTRSAQDLPGTLALAIEAAARRADAPSASRDPAIVYAHHGEVDQIGHVMGPGSDAWGTALQALDDALAHAREQLPPDVAIVVTADHGMVHVPDDGFVDLLARPELLQGVRAVGGDPRAKQLMVHDGALDDVVATWTDHVGGRGAVVTRAAAVAAGWFGPSLALRPAAAERIGDVVVVAADEIAWIESDRDPLGGRLPGQHGAPTDAELRIPAVTLLR